MLILFAVTLFTNACLLFQVQPMISRMILPLLGGASSVWTTCMLFFQAVLLGGYLYAHLLSTKVSFRRQLVMHGMMMLLPLVVLPISVTRPGLSTGTPPVLLVLALLLVSVALPFFVLSTSAPLLQKWLSVTSHPHAKDPYFLYSASNLGSLVGLVSYPLVMEPFLSLEWQARFWMAGYFLLFGLISACAFTVSRAPAAATTKAAHEEVVRKLTRADRFRWVALAFVPSSLMLGVTTYLTTDIAAIPLFWLIPLVLYLVTFIVAFGKSLPTCSSIAKHTAPIAAFTIFFIIVTSSALPLWVSLPIHLIAFFLLALSLHAELAWARPSTAHLTEFYLWISIGGVLGGFFNAVVAPVAFSSILEYPLALLAACLLLPTSKSGLEGKRSRAADFAIASLTTLIAFGSIRGIDPLQQMLDTNADRVIASVGVAPAHLEQLCVAVAFLILVFALQWLFVARPSSFRVSVVLLGLITMGSGFASSTPLDQRRSFFGVLSVIDSPEEETHTLRHGTTIHGKQSYASGRKAEALTYYHDESPIGRVFRELTTVKQPPQVAVVGLGTGTLATYGKRGQRLTFYEIDPAVVSISRNPKYFTFLSDAEARGVDVSIAVGDARLRLGEALPSQFGLIVVDAFSSDAIPVHLLTREALALYLSKLTGDGILAIHISNNYLDLSPVVAALAKEARLAALFGTDVGEDDDTERLGSEWIILSRNGKSLAPFWRQGDWEGLEEPKVPAWRDDFSNLIGVLDWAGSQDESASDAENR